MSYNNEPQKNAMIGSTFKLFQGTRSSLELVTSFIIIEKTIACSSNSSENKFKKYIFLFI